MAVTWASTLTYLAYVAKYVDDNRINAQGALLTDITAINTNISLDQPYLPAGQAAIVQSRKAGCTLMQDGPAHIAPALTELGFLQALPQSTISLPASLYATIRAYMVTNNLAFRSRQFLRGSLGGFAAVGSPVGPVGFYPLFVDEDGFSLENGLPDVVTAQCTADTYSGGAPLGQETFTLTGLLLQDQIDLYQANRGAGVNDTVQASNADTSLALLANPSFSQFSGTITVPTAITGWNVLTDGTYTGVLATDIQIDQSAAGVYRAAVYEGTTPGSLLLKGTHPVAIWQRPSDAGKEPPKGDPTFFALRWRADVNGTPWTGTFSVYVGGKFVTVTVAGQTGWQTLILDLATTGVYSYLTKNCYLKNYQTVATGVAAHTVPGLAVAVYTTPTSGGTSQLNLDDICWSSFTIPGYKQSPLGGAVGGWMVPFVILGTSTPWEDGDTYVATWTETGAKVERMCARFVGPIGSTFGSTTGAPTSTAPVFSLPSRPQPPAVGGMTATDGGAGGALSAGVRKYYVTFVTAQGVESGIPVASVNSPNLAAAHKSQLTGVPTGTAGVTAARKIYSTKAAGSTYYLNVAATAAFNDATTTAYLDNTADAALVTQITAPILAGITQDDV